MRIMGAHRIDRPGQHVVVLRFNGDNENWEEFLGKLGFRANYSFTMRVLRWRVGPLVYCIEKGDCLDIEELGEDRYRFRIMARSSSKASSRWTGRRSVPSIRRTTLPAR